MKKIFFLIITSLVFLSCAEDRTFEGEFIYYSDAAVLKGENFIYGVKIDAKMEELATIVKPLQRDEFDMIPVIVQGTINPKAEGTEGWDSIVTIKKIIEVKEPKAESPVKIESGYNLKTEDNTLIIESDN